MQLTVLLRAVLFCVLIQLSLQVYIVDFGFASSVPSAGSVALDQVAFKGTIDYASRDTLRGNRCSPKVQLSTPLDVSS